MAKNKFLNLILLKVKSSHSTLEHTYTQIPSDQHLQSTVILDRSYLPTDTKASDIEYPPFAADLRQQLARDHMAQTALKTPLGVPAFWDTRGKPTYRKEHMVRDAKNGNNG